MIKLKTGKAIEKKKFNRLLRTLRTDKKSAKEITDAYYPLIYRHVRRRYGTEFFDRIYSEFLLALCAVPQGTEVEYPTTWIYKICDNAAIKIIKEDSALIFTDRSDNIIDRNCFDVEMSLSLKESILRLDEADKSIIYFHYWEGYTFIEIALMLDITHDAVRQEHIRALQKLKRFMMYQPVAIMQQ